MNTAVVFTIFLFNLISVNANGLIHRRFEYKYSFKPPYLAQKDNTIPFFEYGGSKYIFFTILLLFYLVYDSVKELSCLLFNHL